MKRFNILLTSLVVFVVFLFSSAQVGAQSLVQGSEAQVRLNALLQEIKTDMQKVKYGQGNYYILAMRADIADQTLKILSEGKATTEEAVKSAAEQVKLVYATNPDAGASKSSRPNLIFFWKRLKG